MVRWQGWVRGVNGKGVGVNGEVRGSKENRGKQRP